MSHRNSFPSVEVCSLTQLANLQTPNSNHQPKHHSNYQSHHYRARWQQYHKQHHEQYHTLYHMNSSHALSHCDFAA